MEYCKKCFKQTCRCGYIKTELDYYIYPAIYEFNRKGYMTTGCCSGHKDQTALSTYIEFDKDLEHDFSSDYVQFHTYNYSGVHIKKSLIKARPEIISLFKKKRTDKPDLLRRINHDLYRIAREMPCKELNPNIEDIEFPEDYFFDESYSPRLPDIQRPWLMILPSGPDCKEFVNDYYNITNHRNNLYELAAPRDDSGIFRRFSTLSLADRGIDRNQVFKDQMLFDASASPKLFLMGQERDMQIETERFHDTEWILSYVIISPEKDYHYPGDYISNYDIMSDIYDYIDENSGEDMISALESGFNILIKKNVNICAFSSGHDLIIFSNKIDFGYHSSSSGIAAVFGTPVDYDEAELFKHVHVQNKEVFVIINDGILFRKELTERNE